MLGEWAVAPSLPEAGIVLGAYAVLVGSGMDPAGLRR
jgi:hypothetical protein